MSMSDGEGLRQGGVELPERRSAEAIVGTPSDTHTIPSSLSTATSTNSSYRSLPPRTTRIPLDDDVTLSYTPLSPQPPQRRLSINLRRGPVHRHRRKDNVEIGYISIFSENENDIPYAEGEGVLDLDPRRLGASGDVIDGDPGVTDREMAEENFSVDQLDGTEGDWEFPGWGGIQTVTLISHLTDEDGQAQMENVEYSEEQDCWQRVQGTVCCCIGDTTPSRSGSSYGTIPGPDGGQDGEKMDGKAEQRGASAGKPSGHQLNQIQATAIAGNDITSSSLYVISLTILTAGKMAPFSILLVVGLLYLFRAIYTEVVTALPLNGGAYNALLNTTTKLMASVAACLTLLSYTATAVVSAQSGMSYAHLLWCPGVDDKIVDDGTCTRVTEYWGTIALLGIFAVLNLMGLTESANVAVAIFTFHMLTLTVLVGASVVYAAQHPDIFGDNWATMRARRNLPADFFFGFSSALLGISGFESCANFVEELKSTTIFPKALRNMWAATGFFNTSLCFLALAVLPYNRIVVVDPDSTGEDEENDQLLADMGGTVLGDWFSTVVSIDAFCVLSGAVLTGYVGVGGLVKRMALDRCLPQFFLATNSFRGTNHFIILTFFLVTTSLFVLVQGDTTTLAGVYGIAFLGVMAFFTIAAMLLKFKRSQLRRQARAPWLSVVVAFVMVVAGMVGNILESRKNFMYFIVYFLGTLLVVMIMFGRNQVLKILIYFISGTPLRKYCDSWLKKKVFELRSQTVVFFAKRPNLESLNKAILYARENELTNSIKVVHFLPSLSSTPKAWQESIILLDRIYPKMKIDLVLVEGTFSPRAVEKLSEILEVPSNFMFITSPSEDFQHNLKEFGGIRIITEGAKSSKSTRRGSIAFESHRVAEQDEFNQ
eukprot:CAMPEP_0119148174 /NCGR_PEP_ID=MMETSP1310-20130426/41452_1 /TAXON_ID=464262 /ORGANISM="Genus nov. species nov., Strain RCC2339" /LENGTH=881 /DNA_ID=CAMNT_0007140197 /DNA_START=98 /DNA_END=2743 /DNA_ORIENTATION=+